MTIEVFFLHMQSSCQYRLEKAKQAGGLNSMAPYKFHVGVFIRAVKVTGLEAFVWVMEGQPSCELLIKTQVKNHMQILTSLCSFLKYSMSVLI